MRDHGTVVGFGFQLGEVIKGKKIQTMMLTVVVVAVVSAVWVYKLKMQLTKVQTTVRVANTRMLMV